MSGKSFVTALLAAVFALAFPATVPAAEADDTCSSDLGRCTLNETALICLCAGGYGFSETLDFSNEIAQPSCSDFLERCRSFLPVSACESDSGFCDVFTEDHYCACGAEALADLLPDGDTDAESETETDGDTVDGDMDAEPESGEGEADPDGGGEAEIATNRTHLSADNREETDADGDEEIEIDGDADPDPESAQWGDADPEPELESETEAADSETESEAPVVICSDLLQEACPEELPDPESLCRAEDFVYCKELTEWLFACGNRAVPRYAMLFCCAEKLRNSERLESYRACIQAAGCESFRDACERMDLAGPVGNPEETDPADGDVENPITDGDTPFRIQDNVLNAPSDWEPKTTEYTEETIICGPGGAWEGGFFFLALLAMLLLRRMTGRT